MDTVKRVRIIWHRRDLRLADNVLYSEARAEPATQIIPLYIFNPKDFAPCRSCGDASHAVARTGPFATRFLLESVRELRKSLEALGVGLFVRVGQPRCIVPAFIGELLAAGLHGSMEVVWHDEPGIYEEAEAAAVRAALMNKSCRDNLSPDGDQTSPIICSSFWGATLWHPLDLSVYKPRPGIGHSQEVDLSPQSWTQLLQQGVQSFRRKAKACCIRPPLPAPETLPALPSIGVPFGDLPSLTDLLPSVPVFGFTAEEVSQIIATAQGAFDTRSAHPFGGGEAAALTHLSTFVTGPAKDCDRSGGGDAGGGVYSSAKMSAYLAFGCLSPRTVHAVCKLRQDGKADWLPENMEMRDFWIFYALAHGSNLFARDGKSAANLPPNHWRQFDHGLWRRWLLGSTGLPLLDAAMKELQATGYTSNRCRQIPVSVLANDLRIDWRLGAELYEWLLVDHDVGCNWGNWRYFAGVGCDPKRRHYKAISQGLRYDADASFVKTWLPQLVHLPAREAHLIPVRRARQVAADEVDWPEPVVDPLKQLSWDDQKGLSGSTMGTDESSVRADSLYHGQGKGKSATGFDGDESRAPQHSNKGKGGGKAGKGKSELQIASQNVAVSQAVQPGSTGSKARRWHAKAAIVSDAAVGG